MVFRSEPREPIEPTQHLKIGSQSREEWLPLDRLEVDERYQRGLKETFVRKIAKTFDPDLFGKIEVARRADQTYAVVDGQHRIAALRFLHQGHTRDVLVLCDVRTVTSLADEAKMFRALNIERRPPGAIDKFRARLVEGNPVALDIESTLNRHGYRVARTIHSKEHGAFACIALIETIHGMGYEAGNLLEQTMTVIESAWGPDMYRAGGSVVGGIAGLIHRYGSQETYDQKTLVAWLQRYEPADLEKQIKVHPTFNLPYGNRDVLRRCGLVLATMYNHNRTRRLRTELDG